MESKKVRRKILVALIPALVAFVNIGASAQYLFKTLDSRDNLNSSQINCIMKDSKGFVWFGTPSGLYRYDGFTFKNFQSNSQDGTSLPDSYIISMDEMADGDIMIKTTSGVCVYQPETESFERNVRQIFRKKIGIDDKPTVVYVDSHKNLWAYIPGRGVWSCNAQEQKYEFSYTDNEKGIPQGEIVSIGECKDGAILVYRDGTIVCCTLEGKQFTVWKDDYLASTGKYGSATYKVFADTLDNIWLYGQGTLLMYDKIGRKWDTSIGSQLGMTGYGIERGINGMAGDSKGNIWLATDREGLIRMNITTHEMERVSPTGLHSRQREELLKNIVCVYVDDTDLLWVGTEKAGVAYYSDDIYKFEYERVGDVTAIAQDVTGKVWFGTSDKGVIGYDGLLASKKVTCMQYTSDGSVWVGSDKNGLTRIKNGQSTIYSTYVDQGNGLIDDHINALCTDKTGNLWIATNAGLQVFNPKLSTFSTYTVENGKLPSNNVTSLYYGKHNNLFVGTNQGLMIINLSLTEGRHYIGNKSGLKKFTNDYITQILEDSRGLVWVGTREGVNVLDLDTDSLWYITDKTGLCNNCVNGLGEDKNNNVWITTSNGAGRVVVFRDHVDFTFTFGVYNYDTSDGLLSNEFNIGSLLTPSDGNVVMGSVDGVNWIRDRKKDSRDALPGVIFSQLFIEDTEVLTGHEYHGRVPLPQALNAIRELTLSRSQNTFTIKFAAGNYNQCETLQFTYWMEGSSDIWRNADAMTHGATFRNLPSGTYVLHVKAVNADGATSAEERTLTIKIVSPWWIRWWAFILYAIILVILFLVGRNIQQRLKFLLFKKKAVITELMRQRDEIKAASDELKNPMSRMTTILYNITQRVNKDDIETMEQVGLLEEHTIDMISRLSEMQTYLENPEQTADTSATKMLSLNSEGYVKALELTKEFSTKAIESSSEDSREEVVDPAFASLTNKKLQTMEYTLMIVDDNVQFLQGFKSCLENIYTILTYNDITKANEDVEIVMPHIIICKEAMPRMSGSHFCNKIKTNGRTQAIKFVLMTEEVLSAQEMQNRGMTLSADDYLAKPFNFRNAIDRFNHLLGVSHIDGLSMAIEGAETRRLIYVNESMTTSSTSILGTSTKKEEEKVVETAEEQAVTPPEPVEVPKEEENALYKPEEGSLSLALRTSDGYNMASDVDQLFIHNIEQYVMHNMSRGKIDITEMAETMGMGSVPFYRKVRALTKKTPPELVIEIEMQYACHLLKTTTLNLEDLAMRVGFVTADNFIERFKLKYGMLPTEYRMNNRG